MPNLNIDYVLEINMLYFGKITNIGNCEYIITEGNSIFLIDKV